MPSGALEARSGFPGSTRRTSTGRALAGARRSHAPWRRGTARSRRPTLVRDRAVGTAVGPGAVSASGVQMRGLRQRRVRRQNHDSGRRPALQIIPAGRRDDARIGSFVPDRKKTGPAVGCPRFPSWRRRQPLSAAPARPGHQGGHGQPLGHHQGGVEGNVGFGYVGGGSPPPLTFPAKLSRGRFSTTIIGATQPARSNRRLLLETGSAHPSPPPDLPAHGTGFPRSLVVLIPCSRRAQSNAT
jgi:hypothetical protein